MVLPPGVRPRRTPFVRAFTPERDSKPRRLAGRQGRFQDEKHESALPAEKSGTGDHGFRTVNISARRDTVELL